MKEKLGRYFSDKKEFIYLINTVKKQQIEIKTLKEKIERLEEQQKSHAQWIIKFKARIKKLYIVLATSRTIKEIREKI